MKIVMLCDFYNEKLEYQENLLAKYYTKHGHDVVIITSTYYSVFDYYSDKYDKNIPSSEANINGVKVIRLRYSFNILNRLRKYTGIFEILVKEAPSLIFVHDIMLNIFEVVKYKKKNPKCSVIMDYHADYSNSAKNWISLKILHGIIRKYYLDRSKKYIDKIFPVVPAGFVFLNEVYNIPYDDMELLPLGADTDLGKNTRLNNEGINIRKKYGINSNDFVIFSGGKLDPRKKLELLIEAFIYIDNPNCYLFIIGDSSDIDLDYKEKLIRKSQENPNIFFTGWLLNTEVYKYLNASDLAVFPASQSILWQQAISMHLPLIVGNIGHQDISYLNKYGNIIIMDKKSITAENIKNNILKLKNNKQLYKDMKSGAEKITEESLSWDVLIKKTLYFTEDT